MKGAVTYSKATIFTYSKATILYRVTCDKAALTIFCILS
jgi:hypothetical protein